MTRAADSKSQFVELLEAHRGIIVKVANTYCWHDDDRAELMQEIAAQLWYAFPKYDPDRSFSTWMYRVALNVAISYVRKHSQRQRYYVQHSPDPDELPAAGNHAAGSEKMDFLLEFIGQLDPLNRALMLLYLEERSYRDIADVLGISETNVASKISRLKKRVRLESEQSETTKE